MKQALFASSILQLTVPDVQVSRVRFFMEELCSRRYSDGRSGRPAEGDQLSCSTVATSIELIIKAMHGVDNLSQAMSACINDQAAGTAEIANLVGGNAREGGLIAVYSLPPGAVRSPRPPFGDIPAVPL